MKQLLVIFALVLVLKAPMYSQTIYWTEEFNANQGWTLEQNWSLSSGKLQFYWSPTVTNFDLSAVSPFIDLHENTLELVVKQHLDAFGSSNPPEAAEIYLIADDGEYLLWDYTLNYGNWGQSTGSDIAFDISEFAGQTVRIKFRTFGPTTFNWNWWDVFNLKLTALFENDIEAMAVTGPSNLYPNENGTWSVTIKNLGLLPQTDFNVTLHSLKYQEIIGTTVVSEILQPQETISVDFTWTPELAHNTALFADVVLANDEFEDNNTTKSLFVRIKPDIEFSVLVWNNDNDIQTITDPEIGDNITPTTALTRSIDNTGISYQLVNSLPAFLNEYDIIFASLGCYCLS
jgi:hypothetical protein